MTGLTDHLATGVTTICRAWIVRRSDGSVLGFTDHDSKLIVDGVECMASSGLTGGAVSMSTGLSVDNAEASGALSHEAISEADIRAGRWDEADIVAYRVNWTAPDATEITFRGSLGEIAWGAGEFTAELRGAAEALNKTRGRVYQSRCDAKLGDDRCRRILDGVHLLEVEVISTRENRVFAVDDTSSAAPGWFDLGMLVVVNGAATGMSERIKTDRFVDGRREIGLWASLRGSLRSGDRVKLSAGCDKLADTCRRKFGNFQHFRGFPHIPGEEWLMAYPTKDGTNNGGRL